MTGSYTNEHTRGRASGKTRVMGAHLASGATATAEKRALWRRSSVVAALRWAAATGDGSYVTEGGVGVRRRLLWRRNARERCSPSNGGAVARDPNPGEDGASPVLMSGQTARWSKREGGWSDFVVRLMRNRGEQWWSSRWLQCRSKEEKKGAWARGAL
jgi:hypothetical protein